MPAVDVLVDIALKDLSAEQIGSRLVVDDRPDLAIEFRMPHGMVIRVLSTPCRHVPPMCLVDALHVLEALDGTEHFPF